MLSCRKGESLIGSTDLHQKLDLCKVVNGGLWLEIKKSCTVEGGSTVRDVVGSGKFPGSSDGVY